MYAHIYSSIYTCAYNILVTPRKSKHASGRKEKENNTKVKHNAEATLESHENSYKDDLLTHKPKMDLHVNESNKDKKLLKYSLKDYPNNSRLRILLKV